MKEYDEKLIFFDCDGVINRESMWKVPFRFCEDKVQLLAQFSVKMQAKLIMTSTWRAGFEPELEKCSPQIRELRNTFLKYGADISNITKSYPQKNRSFEVHRYIDYSRAEVAGYVIFDDDASLFDKEERNLVLTDSREGINIEQIRAGACCLNSYR